MTNTHHEPNEGNNGNTETGETQKQPNWFVRIRRKYLDGKEAAWTLLFTAALVYFTGKLSQVSNRQNDIAVNSQRGFLTFLGPNLGARMVDNSGAWVSNEITPVWTNTGNTAARNVVIQNNASAFFPDIPEGYSFPLLLPKTRVVIGPKSNYGVNIQMGKQLMVDYSDSKKRLFIWGSAVYSDAFPDTPDRLSEFCVELTHLTFNEPGVTNPAKFDFSKPDTTLINFQWQQCSEHNCYDQDCKDYSERIKDMRTP